LNIPERITVRVRVRLLTDDGGEWRLGLGIFSWVTFSQENVILRTKSLTIDPVERPRNSGSNINSS